MTTKNLVGIIAAALLSAFMFSGCGVESAQANAKSVTPRATQSVTEPSPKIASSIYNQVLFNKKRIQLREIRKKRIAASRSESREYRGKYYDARWESARKCIVHRESRGNYRAENPTSTASGAYQFLINTSNNVAKMMGRSDLVGKPAGRWSKYDQDRAFWTLWNHGKGRSHWGLASNPCW